MIIIIIALLIELILKPRLDFARHYVLLWYGVKKRDYIILKKKI